MKARKGRQPGSSMPEVNLVPMMDVLMTVLTFFIIISMSLTSQTILSVRAPDADAEGIDPPEEETVQPFVIGLNTEGEILIADEPVDETVLAEQMGQYYTQNPNGYIRLKADRELDYDRVAETLMILRDLGGGRVTLAVE